MVKALVAAVIGGFVAWIAISQPWALGVGPTTVRMPYSEFAVQPHSHQFGCKAVASVHLTETGIGGSDRIVEATASRGTDTLAIRVDSAAKQLHVITGADVRWGRTDSEVMSIIRDDDRAIVAVQVTPAEANVITLSLDKKTGNAVWGKLGRLMMVGAGGWAHYLECR